MNKTHEFIAFVEIMFVLKLQFKNSIFFYISAGKFHIFMKYRTVLLIKVNHCF